MPSTQFHVSMIFLHSKSFQLNLYSPPPLHRSVTIQIYSTNKSSPASSNPNLTISYVGPHCFLLYFPSVSFFNNSEIFVLRKQLTSTNKPLERHSAVFMKKDVKMQQVTSCGTPTRRVQVSKRNKKITSDINYFLFTNLFLMKLVICFSCKG